MNIIKEFLFKLITKSSDMEKEILEQSFIIKKILKKYVSSSGNISIILPDNVKKIAIIGSGSSYHTASIAAHYFRNYVKCYAQAYYASEYCLSENPEPDSSTLYVFISQSGETSDTNMALNKVRLKTDKTLAITNTINSTLYNNAKYKILTYAGKEKSIASTKAVSAQLFCLFLTAVKLLQLNEMPFVDTLSQLKSVPDSINNAYKFLSEIISYSKKLKIYDNASVLASGMFYPLAKECALKLKETSYINTTAYPTGEFLHGHIAILNKKCAVIILINNSNIEFTKNVLCKIKNEYSSDLLIISALPLEDIRQNNIISVNTKHDIEFLFTSLVILQLLAFNTATALNRDVDRPNGLTKIVK